MENRESINIPLDHIEDGLELILDEKAKNTLFHDVNAHENGEAEYQIREGCTYDFELSSTKYSLSCPGIVQSHKRKHFIGTISPNIYVGTLTIEVFEKDKKKGEVYLEVQSVKSNYRNDYRDMLEFITEKCTDLLMQANSPVSHNFETDFDNDTQSLYQKFSFIKSIIATEEFTESVHRIVSSPVTQWKEIHEQKDIRNIRRFKNSNVREFISGSKRNNLPDDHFLSNYGLNSIPDKINSARKSDTVDTPENRFIKFALENFSKFCSDINHKAKQESRVWKESALLEKELESLLMHSFFKKISHPETLRLNSPVLQRKEGYREILRVWLMFDLAAKLVWHGGDDVYTGGKKDIATLYEYWLFFKLLDLFKEMFDIEPKDLSELIKETNDGLNLQLKQGKHTALKGVFNSDVRRLNVVFNYNRSFPGGKNEYPGAGSWTTNMRPDYTLSIWPAEINAKEAEEQELIVHIHFDAKYKVANFSELIVENDNDRLNAEKKENRRGVYKNADLLKMHAYKDAIRRTGGAYILYPGGSPKKMRGFHEIIPGLGAFPVSPSKTDDGTAALKKFIYEVIRHFQNRASQRERMAFKSYDLYKNDPNEIHEALPEAINKNRDLIPDETFVLVAYYKEEKLDWIINNQLYNARASNTRGSLRLGPGEAGAKYLLLHTKGETKTGKLFKITETGPRIFSKQTLLKKNYPTPEQDYYLVYKISEINSGELSNKVWDITKLDNFKTGHASALPFAVTLSELMNAIV